LRAEPQAAAAPRLADRLHARSECSLAAHPAFARESVEAAMICAITISNSGQHRDFFRDTEKQLCGAIFA
jgi:hypothetical protein